MSREIAVVTLEKVSPGAEVTAYFQCCLELVAH